MAISSKKQLEEAALDYGLLPFFANRIAGFSVQEMAAPGMLFADTADGDGCWQWKGPVIQEQTTAYGKFFNRKAGFVAMEFLPDFLNYRRKTYPVEPDSLEDRILREIISHEALTSSELRRILVGERCAENAAEGKIKTKRHSIEAPLQRLQMGGHILIANFEYKYTSHGDAYGWGIALYSTPEIWFERDFKPISATPEESLGKLVRHLAFKLPDASAVEIRKLIK